MNTDLPTISPSEATLTQVVDGRTPNAEPTLVLTNLRDRPEVRWTEDTIDNEHLGRRSSKRCCIFHKVKRFGETDSDETSSDESDNDKDGSTDAGESNKVNFTESNPSSDCVKKKKKKKVKNYQRHHA
eukprot:GSChrysophyteH1.ASY1.ANO1.1117.1 assembled CDS